MRPLKLYLCCQFGVSMKVHNRTYVNTIHAVSKFAMKLGIFWCKFGVYVLIIYLLHLAQVSVFFVVVIVAVVSNVAIALLSSLASS